MRMQKMFLFLLTLSVAHSTTIMPMYTGDHVYEREETILFKGIKYGLMALGCAHLVQNRKPIFNFFTKNTSTAAHLAARSTTTALNFATKSLTKIYNIIKNNKKIFGIGAGLFIGFRYSREIGEATGTIAQTGINLARTIKNSISNWLIMRRINSRAQALHMTPIFTAAHEGTIEALTLLVTPANVNAPNANGATLISEAAAQGQDATVQWLLAHGANQAIVNNRGELPIERARAAAHNHTADILLIADITARAHAAHMHPVLYAAHHGIIAGLNALINHANINQQYDQGITALIKAASQGQEEAVRWLLAHGANTEIANARGDRAIDIADAAGFNGVVLILAAHELQRHGVAARAAAAAEPAQQAADDFPPLAPAAQAIQCPICMEGTDHPITLHCGDQCCRTCLNQQLAIGFRERSSATLICPNPACRNAQGARTPWEQDDVHHFATLRNLHRFEELKATEALREMGIRDCITDGCINQFEVQGDQPIVRRCELCSRRYCRQCGAVHNEQVNCRAAAAERNMPEAERASEEWRRAHTKECPNCHRAIEKNGGCNHMTCRRETQGCGHQFCWVCMGPWAPHGNNWYQCNFQRAAAPQEAPVAAPHIGIPAFDPRALGAFDNQ